MPPFFNNRRTTLGMFKLLPPAEKIQNPVEATEAAESFADTKILAVDTETTGLSRTKDRAIILAISDGKRRLAVYPEAFAYFVNLLENPEVKLLFHNANFDQWMLLNSGININRFLTRTHYRVYDTMVMHALINDQAAHDLKSLSKKYLGIHMVPFRAVFGSQMRTRSLEELLLAPENEDIVCNYASLDAYATYHLFTSLREELLSKAALDPMYPTLWDYYVKTELPFTKILWEMELSGIRIDKEALLSLAPKIEDKLAQIHKWFAKKMGSMTVNLNSTAQMGRLFFEHLDRTPLSITAKGNPQLNQTTLNAWAKNGCSYAKKLLRYRELDKKLSTYITNLLSKIHIDGRIHASFNQTGARTGRLSSSSPNLQNQPPYIRSAYIPKEGVQLFAADYAQLEMRILAHFSKDPTLCTAISDGLDVHASTAAKMFKVPYEDIMDARSKEDANEDLTPRQEELLNYRKGAKAINFGLMYGQGAAKLAATLDVDKAEARGLIKQYFRSFPKVTEYFKITIADAKNRSYCSTILGRRRQVPSINSPISGDAAQAERMVKNSPIQGTAADITKMAMIKIWEDPLITASGAKMVIQVHDEIVFEVPKEFVEDKEFNERIRDLMAHPFDFDLAVPLETSGKYGDNWLECK